MSLCVFGQYPNSNPEPNPAKPYLLTLTTVAFRPQSKWTLQIAVDECIKTSLIGDCSEGVDGPIADWDVTAVSDMSEMFYLASTFNQDLSKWDVSAVTNMQGMFEFASAFNLGLSKWDVSAVTNMITMFSGASAFNQDLSKWDVSAVTDMGHMFNGASTFNQDLSKWGVSPVTHMDNMFRGASSFKRNLCGVAWVKSKADKTDMFRDSPGSIASKVCTATSDYGEGDG